MGGSGTLLGNLYIRDRFPAVELRSGWFTSGHAGTSVAPDCARDKIPIRNSVSTEDTCACG